MKRWPPTEKTGATTAKRGSLPPLPRQRQPTATPCCWTAPTLRTTKGTGPVCGPCGRWRCARPCGNAASPKSRCASGPKKRGCSPGTNRPTPAWPPGSPQGTPITGEQLAATERAENYLFSLGFTDFRVRRLGRNAKLQFRQEQMEQVLAHREQILAALKADYDQVWLDLEARG